MAHMKSTVRMRCGSRVLGGALERQCEGNTKDDIRGVSAVGQKMVKSNIWGKFEILCFLGSVC